MKAAVHYKKGPPEVLQIAEIENPPPGENEVRVRVIAAAVNPMDCKMRGPKGLVRVIAKLMGPPGPRIGADFAGVVDAVGPGVTRFKAGDQVFGAAYGACAEFVNAKEGKICLKPKGVSFGDAAALPVAGQTALQGLVDHGQVKKGDRVLVYGASGGIGHFSVQIANALGAVVDAVCSTSNLGWVKELGARNVIDYTKEDFTKRGETYDFIFDTVGYASYFTCRKCLNPDGVFMTANFLNRAANVLALLITPLLRRNKMKTFMTQGTPESLARLAAMVETGEIKVHIDRRFPLDQIVEAHRLGDTGHTKGKVVLDVGQG
jgi:NADPH:quinone reductase-like Zn-dependent oxidoreductase